jgi:DNA-binding transcriptional MerR regulator
LIRASRYRAHRFADDTLSASRAAPVAPPSLRDVVREVASLASTAAQRGGRQSSGGGRRGRGDEPDGSLLTDDELRAVEAAHTDGITAAQIVDLFVSRGIRFSEATFRKYVQQGLLPRSRRVGRKGKHRGSLGVYPAKTVRRINAIKRLMREDYTIEDIQQRVLRFTDATEGIEEGIAELFARLDQELQSERLDARERRELKKDIAEARKTADELLRRLDALSRRASSARGDRYRNSGAAGSAEELL